MSALSNCCVSDLKISIKVLVYPLFQICILHLITAMFSTGGYMITFLLLPSRHHSITNGEKLIALILDHTHSAHT